MPLSQCSFVTASPLVRTPSKFGKTLPLQCSRHFRVAQQRQKPQFSNLSMKVDERKSPLTTAGVWIIIGGIVLTSFLPAFNIIQQAFTQKDNEAYVETILSPIPVFTVTDETGRPLLRDLGEAKGSQGYFFVDPTDAIDYKAGIAEELHGKIVVIGLDEAIKFVEGKADTRQAGKKEAYEIVGNAKEQALARSIVGAGAFKRGVPLFWVEGLAFGDKNNKSLYPLYFEKEALSETLAKAQKQGLNVDTASIQVSDLMQTVKEIRIGGDERLQSVVLLPVQKALQYGANDRATDAAKPES